MEFLSYIGYILKLLLFKIHSVLLKYWMPHVAFYKNLWIVSSTFLPVLSCNSHYYLFYKPRASFLHPVYKALCSFFSIKLSGSAVLPTSSFSGFVNCSWGTESFFLSILLAWYSDTKEKLFYLLLFHFNQNDGRAYSEVLSSFGVAES